MLTDINLQQALRPPARALEMLGELYAQLDRDIAIRQPICTTSGRCCKFEIWGHWLYVSTLELAAFAYFTQMDQLAQPGGPSADANTAITFPLPLYQDNRQFSPGCPWQIDGLCTARTGRPLGCRIYFCDTTAESWQRERYEYYHKQIAALHESFQIPYRYMEWRQALALLATVPK
ncbi:MAG: hypothetical protein ACP5QA_06355 [Phycisphaerae bacterium]